MGRARDAVASKKIERRMLPMVLMQAAPCRKQGEERLGFVLLLKIISLTCDASIHDE